MKKIIIIDGGPRKNFNTASMLQKFADGASSVSSEIEVKTVHLYALDYKGCMSCMACKMKGKASNVCKFKDALTPMLEEIAEAERNGRKCQQQAKARPLKHAVKLIAEPELVKECHQKGRDDRGDAIGKPRIRAVHVDARRNRGIEHAGCYSKPQHDHDKLGDDGVVKEEVPLSCWGFWCDGINALHVLHFCSYSVGTATPIIMQH